MNPTQGQFMKLAFELFRKEDKYPELREALDWFRGFAHIDKLANHLKENLDVDRAEMIRMIDQVMRGNYTTIEDLTKKL